MRIQASVFLGFDKVWDQLTSIEEAKSYLSLPFKDGSVVLVTACSLCILKLLRNVTWKECFLDSVLGYPSSHKFVSQLCFSIS